MYDDGCFMDVHEQHNHVNASWVVQFSLSLINAVFVLYGTTVVNALSLK